MKRIIIDFCFILFTFNFGHESVGQALNKTQKREQVSISVKHFNYVCHGNVLDEGVSATKFNLVTFEEKKLRIRIVFQAIANCAERLEGQVFLIDDTLRIFSCIESKREFHKKEKFTDSLGRKVVERLYLVYPAPAECDCFSTFEYIIKRPQKKIKVLCFDQENYRKGTRIADCAQIGDAK